MWELPYLSDYKTHPPNMGGNWGCVHLIVQCSLHSHWWNIMLLMLLNIFPHFLLQIVFSYFPPLKPRWVLWSEKYSSYLQGSSHKTVSWFLKRTLQARRNWQEIFTVMKSRDLQPRLLYPAKLSFRIEGQIKSFQDEKKTKGVHHHKTIIIWNVKGIYLRKRRSKLSTIKWQ